MKFLVMFSLLTVLAQGAYAKPVCKAYYKNCYSPQFSKVYLLKKQITKMEAMCDLYCDNELRYSQRRTNVFCQLTKEGKYPTVKACEVDGSISSVEAKLTSSTPKTEENFQNATITIERAK